MAVRRSTRQPVLQNDAAATSDTIDRNVRELRGVISRIRHQGAPEGGEDGPRFVIVLLEDPVTRIESAAKGVLRGAIRPGLAYQMFGQWKHEPRWGWTFAFDSATALAPATGAGVRAYLLAHAPFIGPSTAELIARAFPVDEVLVVLRTDPARVASAIRGLTLPRALEIQTALVAREAMEAVEVDVRGLLEPSGVGARAIRGALDRYGGEAAVAIRANPYRLIDEVDGVGWLTADRIGKSIGVEPAAPGRVRAGVLRALLDAEDEGHTCVLQAVLVEAARALLAVPVGVVSVRVIQLMAEGELVEEAGDLFRAATWRAERTIADVVLRLLSPAADPVPLEAAPVVEVNSPANPLEWLFADDTNTEEVIS